MKRTLAYLMATIALLGTSSLFAASSADLRQMGDALMQKGLYAKAADYFQQATQADPNDWKAFESLGNAYMKTNETSRALDAYETSLRIHPNNPTLRTLADSLKGQAITSDSNTPPPVPTSATNDEWETAQPVTVGQTGDQATTIVKEETVVVRHQRPRPTPVTYKDGLAPIDHARLWTQVSLGYNNMRTGDLGPSATGWNQDISTYGWTGSATSPNDGVEVGGQLGFLLSPNNGLAIGLKAALLSNYTLNVNYQNGPSPVTVSGQPVTNSSGATVIYDSDYDQTTLSPGLLPITLDYYLFLPDGGGRFFLSGGVGWYFSSVHVERNYSAVIANSDPNSYDQWSGDLTGNGPGFQARMGREFQVGPQLGLVVYVGARYAKISHFTGTLTDPYGYTANVGLALEPTLNNEVYVEDQTQIGGSNNNSYATIDFTAVEVGFALNFYSF